MNKYIIRLDDASDYMDYKKWKRMEGLLDKYDIKPIFGIIPDNHDPSLMSRYEYIPSFWRLIHEWIDKEWIPAMHGYEHRYVTEEGGINPVNKKSEFAGLSYEEQAEKIKCGWEILLQHDIKPDIFFAPAHTFDENTLKAIKEKTSIRIISDTFAWNVYKDGHFWFIPQQCGSVRWLPFKTVTYCYHPNMMDESAFVVLSDFLNKHRNNFLIDYRQLLISRKTGLMDKVCRKIYFEMRNIRASCKSYLFI